MTALRDELVEIRLMVAENTAILRALARSADRQRRRATPTTSQPEAPKPFSAADVRLLRGLLYVKDEKGEGAA